jgi:hypothetical protein
LPRGAAAAPGCVNSSFCNGRDDVGVDDLPTNRQAMLAAGRSQPQVQHADVDYYLCIPANVSFGAALRSLTDANSAARPHLRGEKPRISAARPHDAVGGPLSGNADDAGVDGITSGCLCQAR